VSPLLPRRTDLKKDEETTRHEERSIALRLGGWGGADVRPTRLFLWVGQRETGQEWLLPLGRSPRLLRRPRRRRHLTVRHRWQVSYLGNPLVTLGLFAYGLGRLFLGGRDRPPRR
jgi:hypothetical protein